MTTRETDLRLSALEKELRELKNEFYEFKKNKKNNDGMNLEKFFLDIVNKLKKWENDTDKNPKLKNKVESGVIESYEVLQEILVKLEENAEDPVYFSETTVLNLAHSDYFVKKFEGYNLLQILAKYGFNTAFGLYLQKFSFLIGNKTVADATVLHWVVVFDNLEAFKILLEYIMNKENAEKLLTIKNVDGYTAMDLAIWENNTDFISAIYSACTEYTGIDFVKKLYSKEAFFDAVSSGRIRGLNALFIHNQGKQFCNDVNNILLLETPLRIALNRADDYIGIYNKENIELFLNTALILIVRGGANPHNKVTLKYGKNEFEKFKDIKKKLKDKPEIEEIDMLEKLFEQK